MHVSQFCTRDVVTADRGTSIYDAARMMRRDHVGALVVVEHVEDGDRPVGIVTDRDLVVEVLAQELPPDTLTVGDILHTTLGSVCESDDIWTAVEEMAELRVRRLPVVDAHGSLRGLLTSDDLVEWFSDSMDQLRGLIAQQIWREARIRR